VTRYAKEDKSEATRRRARPLLATLVLLALVGVSLPALAFALPEGRKYEMVTPPYKAGVAASPPFAVAPDGESLIFNSIGGFAGALSAAIGENKYLAHRSATGWLTTALQPPPPGNVLEFSPTLETVLGVSALAPSSGAASAATEREYSVHSVGEPNTTEAWHRVGVLKFNELKFNEGHLAASRSVVRGGSSDLCHIILDAGILDAGISYEAQLYDLSWCGGEQQVRFIALTNSETRISHCAVELGVGVRYIYGAGAEQNPSAFNAISADGSEIFFTTNVESGGQPECSRGAHQLFLRLGGTRTLEISRPFDASKPFGGCGTEGEVPCASAAQRASAYFRGASEDGSRVFFTTRAPLVGEDHDQGNDLYMATIGCPPAEPSCGAGERVVTSLVQVSHDANIGQAAELQGELRLASDGSRVYFVARGALGGEVNAEGQAPLNGADNLYVYENAIPPAIWRLSRISARARACLAT
jgi:hypothetical protein